jgi:uncharacterized protein (TIGR02284 family)
MSDRFERVEKTIGPVVETLHDGQKAFAESGSHIQDPSIQTFFLEESQIRARFASELEDALHHLPDALHHPGQHDAKGGGTAAGAVHRAWADVKADLGGGDHALLVTAEQGEDTAKEAYKKALKEPLPENLDALLRKQQQHVIQAHNKVRTWRDLTQDG